MSRVTISLGLLAAIVAATPITSAPAAGQTLSNGAYVCNPAHSYPAGASCDASGPTPTLVYPSTTAPPSAGQTLSNGAYICNPAHSYPAGASCDGSGPTPTLVYPSTTAGPKPGDTLSDGTYVCNPAHSYPAGASCDGSGPTPTLVYASTTAGPKAGETLSNGAYVCNPAHSYPAGASCDGSGPTPTLVYPSTTAPPSAGQTLSNGAYVCNPAHSYPAGASCDGSGPTPTLVYPSTTAPPSAGQTLSNGAYVCNPAHSYPAGASCDGSGPTPTLVYPSTTSAPSAGQTLSNGAYVCNPAHSYPGATCSGSPPTLSYYPTVDSCGAAKTTLTTSTIAKPTGVAKVQSSSDSCPLTLAGTDFQFPHLIVISGDGKKTSNTLYNGTVSSSTTSYLNFDIPANYAGKTCDVVFSLPRQDQLQTSSFHLSGNGNLNFGSLAAAAAENADVPQSSGKLGSWTPVPGSSFAVSSGACASGQRIGFSIGADGDRHLDYFQDYNPCPIGLYIIAH